MSFISQFFNFILSVLTDMDDKRNRRLTAVTANVALAGEMTFVTMHLFAAQDSAPPQKRIQARSGR